MHLARNVAALLSLTALHCTSALESPQLKNPDAAAICKIDAGDDAGCEVQPKYPDAAAYCKGRAVAECSDNVVNNCAVTDKETCVAKRLLVCQTQDIPLGKGYDSSKAEACVNAVSAAYADAKLTKDEIDIYTAACGRLFSGTGAAGANCNVDTDCQQSAGFLCVLRSVTSAADAGGGFAGTCQVPLTVAAGESCAGASARCIDGFHCNPSQYCALKGAIADPCSASLPCSAGLKCSIAEKCEAALATGATCTADTDCASGFCSGSLCLMILILAPSDPFCVSTSN